MTPKTFITQGRQAYRDGISTISNPYTFDKYPEQHSYWLQGWLDAQSDQRDLVRHNNRVIKFALAFVVVTTAVIFSLIYVA